MSTAGVARKGRQIYAASNLSQSKPMQRWEYQVVRINVAPPTAPPGTVTNHPAPEAEASSTNRPGTTSGQVFSESYLQQEFPSYYTNQGAPEGSPQAQPGDPAFQLQAYLNSQGESGWEVVGLQHAGPHTFVIFKRPLNQHELEPRSSDQDQLRITLDLASKCLDMLNRQEK